MSYLSYNQKTNLRLLFGIIGLCAYAALAVCCAVYLQ